MCIAFKRFHCTVIFTVSSSSERFSPSNPFSPKPHASRYVLCSKCTPCFIQSPIKPGRDIRVAAAAGRRRELPGAGSDVLSKVSPCHITLGGSFPACHFFSGRRIISPWQMQRGRNTRLFAMQFIKTCFRGGLREHWLEMLIIISDNVLTCLLPYPAASGNWRGAPAGISVCFSRAFPPLPPSAMPFPCKAEYITADRGRRNLLPVEKQLVGGEGRGKETFILFIFYFPFFFFFFGPGSCLAGRRE